MMNTDKSEIKRLRFIWWTYIYSWCNLYYWVEWRYVGEGTYSETPISK